MPPPTSGGLTTLQTLGILESFDLKGMGAVTVTSMHFIAEADAAIAQLLDCRINCFGHVGDGNLHFAAWPETTDTDIHRAMGEAVEEETIALGGSFSAEHGIGLSKLPAMGRYKDPVAMEVMRTIKRALDPNGIMNPGKVLP